MRATKYVLVAAGVIAVLAMLAWFLRDSLIQRISNPLLQDYGISVTDVSLDALASGDATIGYLELKHDKGTTIAIEGLTLPLAASGGSKTYTARKVSIITSTRTDGELFELAQLVNQFLSLPDNLDNSAVTVAEFSLPPYPIFRDVNWVLTGTEQRLQGTVDSVPMSATITRIDAQSHNIVFTPSDGQEAAPGHFVTGNLRQSNQEILINGTSSIDLPTWEPLAALAGIIPPEIGIEAGTATLQFNVEIPHDATRSPTATADFTASSPLQLTYTKAADDIASILVESASPLEIAATFPVVEWSLQLPRTSVLVNYGEWQSIPLVFNGVSCQSGPTCVMDSRVAMGSTNTPLGKLGRVEFVSAEKVLFPDSGIRLEVQPGATFEMTGFATAEASLGRVEAQLMSTATVELIDAGWRLTADAIDANIVSLSPLDPLSVSTPVFLKKLVASELDEVRSASSDVYIPSAQATLDTQTIALPGVKGTVSLRDAQVAIDSNTVGLQKNGTFTAQHNIETGQGRINITGAAVSFEAQSLSNRISPWPNDRDIIAGTISVDLDANWKQSDSNQAFTAQTTIGVSDLAGYYADMAFAGLSTELNATHDGATGIALKPSSITIELIDIGLPVEDTSADYALAADLTSVDIENLRMTAFGGVVTADPFSFHTETGRNTLTLRAESIDLSELLSLNEFEAIDVSGSIAAVLPVTIENDTVTISNGTLTGEPAGGVIRYLPDGALDEADASTLGLVRRALSNFEFNTLTSDVNLTEAGDLNLQLQLTGRNPDLDGERPVVLNLGVENNIPQMLKSLRAARAVEEILEKRLNK